ncbi:1,4-alpha-glucan-branching enzyme [Trema orientale]|uniref:1,4-alpha-glucan-branching enzyme n=1 Tax=Trema orientale TaxID=63057 RepID=A0A2P5FSX6_TREOI|nr:1,4-alpha-glucan-branching enzyme [Trema orientale]
MATSLLSHIKALSLLIFLLLFIQHHGRAQHLFGNPFPFSGEGFLNQGQGQGQGASFFPKFPFFTFPNYPPPTTGDGGDDGVATPGASTPADSSDPNAQFDPSANPDLETNFKGKWAIVSKNSGVSGMHIIVLPNNKVIMYDASAFRISDIKLANGVCVPFKDKATNKELQDCWSHGVELDVINNAKIRTLKLLYDPWCSSGGLAVDGTLVGTGGWDDGVKTVRYLKPCDTCDFQEYQTALADPRWYATQINLPDGGFLVVGGRRAYSYEYVPPAGKSNKKANFLSLLDETTDLDENNLYPFVHLSTDGNVFIFANNRSILLNLDTNEVVRELPALPGGARNYPASGMSALLPIRLDLRNKRNGVVPAEVIVCGGARHDAYGLAGRGTFVPALDDCNRLTITDPKAIWRTETMPSRRVMGDMLILPNGDLLIVNGAKLGTAAWWFAEEPNFAPVLYRPDKPVNNRFEELERTDIPRMYHSSAAVLPDGRVLIAGSNTNPGYNYTAKYPTELRVEAFTPPYLAPELRKHRPEITPETAAAAAKLGYGQRFEVLFRLRGPRVSTAEIKVTMYPPPFTTHGYSMNQRLVVLDKEEVARVARGQYRVVVAAPPSAVLAPPGYYLFFVVYRGVPSEGIWVRIK